ncbi:hypothetical protein [Antrihabitans sp. YC2-6]|uniref:hypothetical protein n=1 Tax=Antrihabitans sp. YC2-6 TaxID=2799498 RepID=UPI0018F33F88|nr:hypothetical protein [Antrihabitans sp. YC2-6]MBJ8343299.1 hypothetical protein [Antrihabitans sp. YC2-6]
MGFIDKGRIKVVENPAGFTHQEIYDAAHRLSPNDDVYAAWADAGTRLGQLSKNLSVAVQSAIEGEWIGTAADAAVTGFDEFGRSVVELAIACAAVGDVFQKASNAAHDFQSNLPEVVTVGAQSNERTAELRNREEERAREVMQTFYIDRYGAADRELPVLPRPFNPVAGSVGETGAPDSNDSSGSGAGQNHSIAAGTVDEQVDSEIPTQAGADTQPAAPVPPAVPSLPGLTDDGGAQSPGRLPSTVLASNSDAGPVAGTNGNESSGPRAGSQPGSGGSTVTPIAGSPVAASPVAGVQPGAQNAAGRGGASGVSGRPGALAPGGMVPPAARSKRDEDEEHKIPSYLVTEDNCVELIGTLPPYIPPVLGA